jgi:3-oxoadipate enol-lactonase
VADTVMGRYFHPTFRASRPEQAAMARGTLLRNSAEGYAASCAAVLGVDWRAELGAIKCPTLVIAGGQDAGAPVAMSEAIVAAIAGARLAVIDNASHISVMEEPTAFAQLVKPFLLA